jgi:hypothetical protein
MKIIKNCCQCAKCGDIIESTHVHDFVTCTCGAVSVDGGHHYIRRLGNKEDIIPMDIIENEEKENEIKERIDKVVSEKSSTWKEEAEEHEKNHKLYDKLADVELRLECCRDASNGKDLLITALEKRIADLEYQAFQFAMRSERSPKAYVEKCDDGSFNVCFGVFQRKYVPVKSRLKEMK